MDESQVVIAIIGVLGVAVSGLVAAKRRKNVEDSERSEQAKHDRDCSNRCSSYLPHNFSTQWQQVFDWTKESHRLHNRLDQDGIPVWYLSKEVTNAIKAMSDAMVAQTEILRNQQQLLQDIKAEIKK